METFAVLLIFFFLNQEGNKFFQVMLISHLSALTSFGVDEICSARHGSCQADMLRFSERQHLLWEGML